MAYICKKYCAELKKAGPGLYDKNQVYCSTCRKVFEKSIINNSGADLKIRCPCCSSLVRQSPWRNTVKNKSDKRKNLVYY